MKMSIFLIVRANSKRCDHELVSLALDVNTRQQIGIYAFDVLSFFISTMEPWDILSEGS